LIQIKNPASSPASDIRERKYRDCEAKIRKKLLKNVDDQLHGNNA
jgi:hypothetical protein